MFRHATSLGLLWLSLSAVVSSGITWGPAFSLGPAKHEIISTTTTIYPGKLPTNQRGYLFAWLGISSPGGDLIQSIIGSYKAGNSECKGSNADTAWCISSEVYGLDSSGHPVQLVGSLTTSFPNYAHGIKLAYTLVDKKNYVWQQTMKDAVTGDLLSTFKKSSGPMVGWGTALECQESCTGTMSEQVYVNTVITLDAADPTFVNTRGASSGVIFSDMKTADGGKTWIIAKITIPAME